MRIVIWLPFRFLVPPRYRSGHHHPVVTLASPCLTPPYSEVAGRSAGGVRTTILHDRPKWPANADGIARDASTPGCTTNTSPVILSSTALLTEPATRPARRP